MPKTYHLRLTGGDTIDVPEDEYRVIEGDIMARSDHMIKAAGVMFQPRDVKRVSSSWNSDIPSGWQEDHPEITDEMRENNLKRLAVLRNYLFSYPRQEWVNPYSSDDIRSTFTRDQLREFRKEYFDVRFETHEQTERAARYWILYNNGERDPRLYDRQKAIDWSHQLS